MRRQTLMLSSTSDPSTASSRSRERYRRIGLAVAASVLQRAVSIAVTLVTVPVLIDYLGVERYGVYATITSLVALAAFADLGIGNGLINAVAGADGRGDRAGARVFVSSAYAMLTMVALILGATFALTFSFIPWDRVFNVQSGVAAADAAPAVAAFGAAFLLSLPLSAVQRIQLGLQEGAVNGLWITVGQLLLLVGLLSAVVVGAPLSALVLVFAWAPVVVLVANTALLFGVRRRWLRPSLSLVERKASRYLLHVGFFFFLIQLGASLGYASDNVIIAHVLGPEAVPQYAVPFSLAMFVPVIVSFFLMPLWPAYRASLAEGDVAWVRLAFRRSVTVGLAVSLPGAAVLVVFGKDLVHAWVGEEIDPTLPLLIGLAVWSVAISSINGPLAMLLNGAGIVRFQAACSVLMALANVPLSILLVAKIGVEGAIYGTLIAHTLFVLVPSTVVLRRWFRALPSESLT